MESKLKTNELIKEVNQLLEIYESNFPNIPENNVEERENAFLKQGELFRKKGFEFANNILIGGEDIILKIKSELGEENEIYKEICDKWVGMILTLVGSQLSSYSLYSMVSGLSAEDKNGIINLNGEALKILIKVKLYYIGPENFEYLIQLINKIKAVENKVNPSSSCYIATLIYKDYDSYEVSLLRQYRDLKLNNSFLGRKFISFYYYSNPFVYPILKRSVIIQAFFKYILDVKIRKMSVNNTCNIDNMKKAKN